MTDAPELRVTVMEVGPLAENAYIVGHPASGKAVLIDPGEDAEAILGQLSAAGMVLDKILLTHGHFDHVGGVRLIKERTGAGVYAHPEEVDRMLKAPRQGAMFGLGVDKPPAPDVLVRDGDIVPFVDQQFRVLHTPGHTPGHVAFVCGGLAFVGDLIFAGSIGRTDLPGGSHLALVRSVREKIFTLPDDTILLPGHGPATTVGEERRSNPFFTGGM